jgi:hypothetical protein
MGHELDSTPVRTALTNASFHFVGGFCFAATGLYHRKLAAAF